MERTIYKDLLKWKSSGSGKVLELRGARQVGKTYILEKFASENYSNVIHINLVSPSGKAFSRRVKDQELLDSYDGKWIHNVLTAYDSKFSDNEDTIVIIDEIQESAAVYSLIRNFSRDFKAHFIVTGSYLGKTVDKEFFKSAGDVESLTLYPLSFEEFLMARGKVANYSSIDLFGGSSKSDYEDLYREYLNYLQIGGTQRLFNYT